MNRARTLGLAFVGFLVTGCYALHPVAFGVTPEVGARVAIEVNDMGRVALGGSMGPEIDRILGRLVGFDSAGYEVAVEEVHLLRGGIQVWNHEKMRIAKDQIRAFSERRYSRGRSLALGAVGVGSVAFLLSRGLLGAGLGDPPGVPSDSGDLLRVIWP